MNRLPGIQIDTEKFQGVAQHSRWRFILLILVFNILLITTLLLSMQHQELRKEYQLLVETRIIFQDLLITQEVIEPMTITIVVPPGFTPQPTSIEP
jgi:hypothetical protein